MIGLEILWKDRKRHFGLPISFTRYSLSEDRLFRKTGLLNLKEEEILLYRVRDISLTRSLGQRVFGVGTVIVHSSDKTSPTFEIIKIRYAEDVKEQIFKKVEEAKAKRRMRTTELLEDDTSDFDEEKDE